MNNSTFKNRYNNDERFKKKQLEYMKAKVICPDCQKLISRSNMIKHRSRKWHKQLIDDRQVKQELEKLKNIIEQLKNNTNSDLLMKC